MAAGEGALTLVTASEDAKVPAPFAASFLNGYFRTLEHDGAHVRLELHVPLEELGIPCGLLLLRRAVAVISDAPHVSVQGAQGRALAITWQPESGGPFPAFSGTLAVVNSVRPEHCVLVISGSYRPPGGLLGTAFDGAIGSRIARATAHDLLRSLRERIEADYAIRQQMA